MDNILLEVSGLKTYFHTSMGVIRAVDGVNLHVSEGEAIGIVGESGCGKTMTALSIMGLLPLGASIRSGEILYQGKDLASLKGRDIERIRGSEIGMIFQEPDLNPLMDVGSQLKEIFISSVGDEEEKTGKFKLKELKTGEEKEVSEEEIKDLIF